MIHRFYITNLPETGESVSLPYETARQCSRVLKLQPGEQIALFDGSSREAVATILSVTPSTVLTMINRVHSPETEPSVSLEMVVGLPRSDKWEWILQKCVELGASSFQPVITSRCVARPSAEEWRKKMDRWRRIVTEATEQSGRTQIAEVRDLMDFSQILNSPPTGIVLHTGPIAVGIGQAIARCNLNRPGDQLRLLTGPEGGLSEMEVAKISDAGWCVASMGMRILRCETAAVAACVLAMYATGQMGDRFVPSMDG